MCLPVRCCVGIQLHNITPVLSEFLGFGLRRAEHVENACLHPFFTHVFSFVVLGYTFFIGCRSMVIIGGHSATIAETTTPRAVDKYVLHLSYQTAKHNFTAVLVHFPYFMPPKWEKTVGAQNVALLLLRTPKSRVTAPPRTP